MRTKFFNFASTGRTRRFAPTANCYRLLLLLLCPIVGMAQSNITISNFAAAPGTDGAPTTITFNIEWAPPEDEDKVWSDTVWVFVDYNNAGTMTRLPLALNAGATLTQHSAAGQDGADVVRLEEVPDNTNGVWVVGNARATQGAFSATVQLVETWRATSLHGLCVYAINYPPRAQYTDDGNIKLNGTPPFYLTFSDGAATVSERDGQDAYTYPPEGNQLLSLTDASLAPGSVPPCMMPAAQTLTASAETYCASLDGVTLSLAGTEDGAVYQLYKDNNALPGATFTGNGTACTFTNGNNNLFQAGTYTVETLPGAYCRLPVSDEKIIVAADLPAICWYANIDQCSGFTLRLNIPWAQMPDRDNAAWISYCQSLGTGWRLPSLSEMQCLCDALKSTSYGFTGAWTHTTTNVASGCGTVRFDDANCVQYSNSLSKTSPRAGTCIK